MNSFITGAGGWGALDTDTVKLARVTLAELRELPARASYTPVLRGDVGCLFLWMGEKFGNWRLQHAHGLPFWRECVTGLCPGACAHQDAQNARLAEALAAGRRVSMVGLHGLVDQRWQALHEAKSAPWPVKVGDLVASSAWFRDSRHRMLACCHPEQPHRKGYFEGPALGAPCESHPDHSFCLDTSYHADGADVGWAQVVRPVMVDAQGDPTAEKDETESPFAPYTLLGGEFVVTKKEPDWIKPFKGLGSAGERRAVLEPDHVLVFKTGEMALPACTHGGHGNTAMALATVDPPQRLTLGIGGKPERESPEAEKARNERAGFTTACGPEGVRARLGISLSRGSWGVVPSGWFKPTYISKAQLADAGILKLGDPIPDNALIRALDDRTGWARTSKLETEPGVFVGQAQQILARGVDGGDELQPLDEETSFSLATVSVMTGPGQFTIKILTPGVMRDLLRGTVMAPIHAREYEGGCRCVEPETAGHRPYCIGNAADSCKCGLPAFIREGWMSDTAVSGPQCRTHLLSQIDDLVASGR